MLNTIRKISPAPGLVRDFSEVYPEGLVASSQWPAEKDIHVMRFRHDQSELRVPALENIVVMINLSSIANVTICINGQTFSRLLQEGESVIIPAGTASEWRCSSRRAYEMLHIYLRPSLLRKAAGEPLVKRRRGRLGSRHRREHLHDFARSILVVHPARRVAHLDLPFLIRACRAISCKTNCRAACSRE